MTFSNVAPRKIVKVGVMGYENLSYCIGKTPKKVSGPKNFLGPVRKLGPAENLSASKSGFFNFQLFFRP